MRTTAHRSLATPGLIVTAKGKAMANFDVHLDYYAVLRVPTSATAGEITKAFRRAVSRAHPDRKGGTDRESTDLLVQINAAGRVLRDPALRSRYDAARATNESSRGGRARADDASARAHAHAYQPPEGSPSPPTPAAWERAQERLEKVWMPRVETAKSPGWALFTALLGLTDAYLTARHPARGAQGLVVAPLGDPRREVA